MKIFITNAEIIKISKGHFSVCYDGETLVDNLRYEEALILALDKDQIGVLITNRNNVSLQSINSISQ